MRSKPRADRDAKKAREILGASLTEKQFMATVIDLARLLGWSVYHAFDSRHSEPGFPDLVLVRDGRIIFAELKTPTGRLTEEQRAWLEALEKCPGVEVCVWRPDALKWIEATLRVREASTGEYDGLAPQVESTSPNSQTSEGKRRRNDHGKR